MNRRFLPHLLISTLLLITVGMAAGGPPLHAQAVDWEATAEYQFGQEWTFRLRGEAAVPVTAVTLTVRAAGLSEPYRATVRPADETMIDVVHTVDVVALPVRPFAEAVYSWQVETATGERWQVPPQGEHYVDSSLGWQMAQVEQTTVFWAAGEPEIGPLVAGIVADTLPDLVAFIDLPAEPQVTVVVYPSAADLRRVLRLTGETLQRGRPHPRLGSVLVTAVNSRTAAVDLRRDLPPALAHHFLYQAAPTVYDALPVWFVEGLTSSLAAPDPRFASPLTTAAAAGNLLPLSTLCTSFPADADALLLARAQADSIVRFIDTQHDVASLLRLYAAGVDCETAVLQAYDQSLSALEAEWQRTLQPETAVAQFFHNNLLWFLLLLGGFLISALFLQPGKKNDDI